MTAAVVIGIVMVATLVVAVIYRKKHIKAPLPILTLGLVLALGFGVVSHNRAQTQDDVNRKARELCLITAGRSVGNRDMWSDIADYLAQKGAGNEFIAFVRQRLDVNLPALDPTKCPAP